MKMTNDEFFSKKKKKFRKRVKFQIQRAEEQLAEIRARNKVRIKTKVNKKDVESVDFYPMDKE